MVNANNPNGDSSDMTNLGSKDGEKTDTMSKRTLKTKVMKNVCKSEAGCINDQTQ